MREKCNERKVLCKEETNEKMGNNNDIGTGNNYNNNDNHV